MPADAVAGTVAARWATRPTRPWRSASDCRRRSKSVGTSATESPSTVTTSASVPGITVIVNGSGPGKTPKRSPKPNTISETV